MCLTVCTHVNPSFLCYLRIRVCIFDKPSYTMYVITITKLPNFSKHSMEWIIKITSGRAHKKHLTIAQLFTRPKKRHGDVCTLVLNGFRENFHIDGLHLLSLVLISMVVAFLVQDGVSHPTHCKLTSAQ